MRSLFDLAKKELKFISSLELPETLEECAVKFDEVSQELITIDDQLSRSQEDAQNGRPPNWSWIRKARHAKHLKHMYFIALKWKIDELQAENLNTIATLWMDESLKYIDPDTRSDIWDAIYARRPDLKKNTVVI
jgi:hypothetical protein